MEFVFDETLGFLLNRASLMMREELQRRFREDGVEITAEEWALLGALLGATGGQNAMPVSELAKATLKDRTTVTRLMDRLVEKKWVQRKRDAGDLRIVLLTLTNSGEKTTLRLIEVVKKFLSELQSEFAREELAITKSVLARLCQTLESGS